MALNKFNLAVDKDNRNILVRNAPTYVDARVLAANTNESVTVPAGAKIVLFSSNGDFYARPGGTAAVPAADVTDGTASEMNPSAWDISNEVVSSIGVIAPSATVVTLTFYS